jgi:hypothetical protein
MQPVHSLSLDPVQEEQVEKQGVHVPPWSNSAGGQAIFKAG